MDRQLKKLKRTLGISDGVLIAIAVVLFAVMVLTANGIARRYQRQLDLGRKYYLELQYDKAVLAYETAINIDPRSMEAYEELAQIYIDQDDYDSAIVVMSYAAEHVEEKDRVSVNRHIEEYQASKKEASEAKTDSVEKVPEEEPESEVKPKEEEKTATEEKNEEESKEEHATEDEPKEPSTKNSQTGRSNEQEVYASVVRDYESTYGKLTFNVDSWNNRYYTGVFLIKLIDFDADGTRELLIGYATKNMYGDLSNPWMDVWTVKDGKPIKILDKATVQHGDIGSHCSYIKWNGKDCIVTGYDGGDIKLNVYACENGSFHSILTLKCEYTGADYRWILDGSEIGDEEGLTLCNRIRNEGIEYYGILIDHGDISADTIQAELKEAYALLGL